MRKEIEELNNASDEFINQTNNEHYGDEEFWEKQVKEYQGLMVKIFSILKEEWKEDRVKKDIALLMMTIGELIAEMDDDGNVLGNEEYERVTSFHSLFIQSMFRYDYFRFDDGKLLIDTFSESVLHINPDTFELPSLDELYD